MRYEEMSTRCGGRQTLRRARRHPSDARGGMAPKKTEDAAEIVGKVGELTSELAKLLPRAQKALATKLVEVEQATAALREAETKLVAREEACAAAARSNEQLQETLKAREDELARRAAAVAAQAAPAPAKPSKSGKVDSLGMQILARATAAALLKYDAREVC